MPITVPAARLMVLADDALVRAGLTALLLDQLADRPEIVVAGDAELGADGQAALAFYDPDLLLIDLGWDADASSRRLAELELSARWVALVPQVDSAAAAWQAGAHAVLPRTAGPQALVAALLAVSCGLEVAAPEFGRSPPSDIDGRIDWPPFELTPRELEVLALLAEGLPNKSIARRLGISDHTVKFHVNAVLGKLGARSRTEAAMRAARLGLLRLKLTPDRLPGLLPAQMGDVSTLLARYPVDGPRQACREPFIERPPGRLNRSMNMSDALRILSTALADTVAGASASVVRVEARRRQSASGIVWAADGLVVTANHVVRHDNDIQIGLADGRTVPAVLLGRDPGTDLALLRAQAGELAVPAWATDSVLVGELVLAIGRPGDELETSLGVVNAVGGRWLTGAGARVDQYVRASVEMLPGFSGGPVVNASGQIVGLATSGLDRSAAAILPEATVRRVVEELLAHGRVRRGYLGITANPVRLPEGLGDAGQHDGLMLVAVEPDSPAASAGLMLGDVIVALDGKPVRRMEGLLARLTGDLIGQTVTVQVLRSGQPQDVSVAVSERPADD